jgi:hypothetical protein
MKYTYDILDKNNNMKQRDVSIQNGLAEGLEYYWLPKHKIELPLFIQEIGIVITKIEQVSA